MAELINSNNLLNFYVNKLNINSSWDNRYRGWILIYPTDVPGKNPYHIIGGNQALVLQLLPNDKDFARQFAFGFGNAAIATRVIHDGVWNDWEKLV